MKTNKVLFVVLSLLVIASMLSACATPAATTAAPAATNPPAAKKPYIAMISKGFQHQFWQAVKQGALKAGQDFNVDVTFEGPETEAMVDKQMEMLQTALDKKPDGIAFAALDSKAAIPLLQKAKDAGIPVVGFDSGVDSDIPLTTAATDNIAAAATVADHMAALIGPDGGEVALICHDQTSRTGIDRTKGFTDQINNKYPKLKLIDTEFGAGDPLKSTDIAKAVMTGHPNLKGYFGCNEGSMKGVMNAAKELGKEGKIVMIGYDAGQQLLDEIRSGVVAGAVTQDPIGIGYKSVQALVDAKAGKTLPKFIDTGFHWYDKTNIDDPAIAALLYK